MNTSINTSINNSIIQNKIRQKNGHCPLFVNKTILTDYDHFPNKRWWRGVPTSSVPRVAEREAGFRPRHDECYMKQDGKECVGYPNHCFEAACSTVYPCYPDYLDKYAYKETRDIHLNRACIVQYR